MFLTKNGVIFQLLWIYNFLKVTFNKNPLSKQEGDCEVCIAVLKRFMDTVPKEDSTKPDKIEAAFKKFCADLKLKENR